MSTPLRAVIGRTVLSCALGLSSSSTEAAEFFISPDGSDKNPGTRAEPLATLHAAQQKVREWKQTHTEAEPIVVTLAAGTYELASPWQLQEEDSGSADQPITYRAADNAMVRILGGKQLTAWTQLDDETIRQRLTPTAAENVWTTSLNGVGIQEFGEFQHQGTSRPSVPAPLELFVQGTPWPRAAWPNTGWAQIETVASADPHHLTFQSAQPPRGNYASFENVWVHGFWTHDWTDSYERLTEIQANGPNGSLTINTNEPELPVRPNARFRIVNAFEELDQPGEWYADRATGNLYVWPLDESFRTDAVVSVIETPVSIYGCHHVHLTGLTIEAARGMGIEVAGGSHITIERCTVRNVGNVGVHLYHGQSHLLTECEIYHTGDGGVRVEAGDRSTLTSCDHRIERNTIHHFGRICPTYRPGIELLGVGIQVSQNEIHSGPHAAILVSGNDHDIAYNDIHHVATDTDDVGAIYLGHNPTHRGNSIRSNYLHDLGGFSTTGVIGVYLDDFASGTQVVGNVFQRAGRAIAVGGGRDNLIENNVITGCVAGIQVDNRGETWASSFFTGSPSQFEQALTNDEVDFAVFSQQYPDLLDLHDQQPARALGNVIRHNVVDGPHALELLDGLTAAEVTVVENFVGEPGLIQASDQEPPQLDPESPIWSQGFAPIPWSLIGPKASIRPAPRPTTPGENETAVSLHPWTE